MFSQFFLPLDSIKLFYNPNSLTPVEWWKNIWKMLTFIFLKYLKKYAEIIIFKPFNSIDAE